MKKISARKYRWPAALLGFSSLWLSVGAQAQTIERQIIEYRKTITICKKTSPPTDRCQKQLKMAYEGFEASFQKCTPGEQGMPMAATPSECAALEKFMAQEFVMSNPSFTQVSKALKFINQRSQMSKTLKQSSL